LEATQVRRLLHEMTDEALDPRGGRVLRYTVPDVVSIPDSLTHEDGRSVFRDPSYERWSTPEMLDAEQRFLRSAAQLDAPAIEVHRAAERIGFVSASERASAPERETSEADAERAGTNRSLSVAGSAAEVEEGERTGAEAAESVPDTGVSGTDETRSTPEYENKRSGFAFGLAEDQAAAVYGVLTSGRRIDVLEGFAGTGKSYTVSRLAQVWREMTGHRVIGLTTAQNAAQVLQAEGLDQAKNIARFLKDGARLSQGQLVVVDESSMVTTDHLAQIQQAADQAGA